MAEENLPDVYRRNDIALSDMHLDFEVSESADQGSIPTITIDQGRGEKSVKAGTFNFGGEAMEEIIIAPLKTRDVRRLMMRSYEDRRDGEDNEVACLSWDGVHAIGRGSRNSSEPTTKRACATCPSGEWKEKGQPPPICKPYLDMLVMVQMTSDEGIAHWTPAFFIARGQNVKFARSIFRDAKSAAFRHQIEVCFFAFKVAMDKAGANGTWVMKIRGPKKMEESDANQISEFVLPNEASGGTSPALAIWEARLTSDNSAAKLIGDLDDVVPSSPSSEAEEIPF